LGRVRWFWRYGRTWEEKNSVAWAFAMFWSSAASDR
jgi:hypothetical protein